MAVALPHLTDRETLLTYVGLLHDTEISYLRVSDTEHESLEEACNTILDHLAALRLFFTNSPAGISTLVQGAAATTAGEERVSGYTADPQRSLFPSLVNTSITYVMSLREPRSFFESHSEELQAALTRLLSAKKTLRALSQSRCCILTADVPRLKQFVQSSNRRGTTESLIAKTDMRAVVRDGDIFPPPPLPATASHPGAAALMSEVRPLHGDVAAATAELPLATKLLGIPDACIPSDSVRESYAALLQGCDAVVNWVGDLLKWANHGDDVPRAGTFQVDQPEAEAAETEINDTTSSSPVAQGAQTGSGSNDGSEPKKPRTRTVQIKRYEINDAWHIFAPLRDQAQLFFLSDYTTYDARLHCRLLHPDYYVALSGLIDEIAYEIRHMEARAAHVPIDYSSLSPYGMFQHNGYSTHRDPLGSGNSEQSKSDATLVFRPPVSAFKSLRGELALYLSFCVYEDDLTSLTYYQRLYINFLSNAQEVVRAVRELPKPSQSVSAPTPAEPVPQPSATVTTSTTDAGVPAHLMTNTFRQLQVDHSDRTAIPTETRGDWSQSAELRALLVSRFESFVELRERVHYLKKGLENDIKHKNRTHSYLPAKAAVMKESTREVNQLELDLKALDEKIDRQTKPRGFWNIAKASWNAIADVATCKAEIDPYATLRRLDPSTADEVTPCRTSPLCQDKRLLLAQVLRLWKVVEIQASQLEATYPNLFDRGAKEKLVRRVNELIDKAASGSVVFDSSS